MNEFQTDLQMLNVGDFQASPMAYWEDPAFQSGYYLEETRRCGGCFRCGGGGFRCGGCFRCGGRCFGCFGCFSCFGCFGGFFI